MKKYLKQITIISALILGAFLPQVSFARINPPTNIVATPGNGKVYISFTPSTVTAGEKIEKYYAYTSGSDADLRSFYYEGWSTTSPIVVSVPNNWGYTFRVYAVAYGYNSSGDSTKSNLVTPSEEITTSDTTSVGTGSGSDNTSGGGSMGGAGSSVTTGRMSINIDAVDSTTAHASGQAQGFPAGSTLYIYYTYEGGQGKSLPFTTDGSKNFSFDIKDLIPGRYYGYATGNKSGTESYSTGSFQMPFAGLFPGAPTNVVATPDDASVTLTFTPPKPASSSEGSKIKFYSVRITPDGRTFASGVGSPLKVVGLENGKSYQFEIRAQDMDGFWGPYSTITKAVKTNGPTTLHPDAPLNVIAVAGDKKATVSFTPLTPKTPSAGSKIKFYSIRSTPDIGHFPNNTTSPIIVDGLENGKTYTFTVKAQDMDGFWGPESNSSNPVKPVGKPDAPRSLSVTPGSQSATVRWMPPANDGGSPITSYTVTIEDDPQNFSHKTSKGTSLYVSNLINGNSYKFGVVATNKYGDSPKVISDAVMPSGEGISGDDTREPKEEDSTPTGISQYFQIKNPLKSSSMEDFIARILEALVLLMTPILVLAVIASGFLFVKARGNPEELSTAKTILLYTLVGAAIILGAKVIASALANTLNNF